MSIEYWAIAIKLRAGQLSLGFSRIWTYPSSENNVRLFIVDHQIYSLATTSASSRLPEDSGYKLRCMRLRWRF